MADKVQQAVTQIKEHKQALQELLVVEKSSLEAKALQLMSSIDPVT